MAFKSMYRRRPLGNACWGVPCSEGNVSNICMQFRVLKWNWRTASRKCILMCYRWHVTIIRNFFIMSLAYDIIGHRAKLKLLNDCIAGHFIVLILAYFLWWYITVSYFVWKTCVVSNEVDHVFQHNWARERQAPRKNRSTLGVILRTSWRACKYSLVCHRLRC